MSKLGSDAEAGLRRLVGNRTLAGALVVLGIIVAGFAGYALGHIGGFASGYSAGYSDGNPDYTRIQESVKSTEVNDFGYLQQVLSNWLWTRRTSLQDPPWQASTLSIPCSRLQMFHLVCSDRI